MPGVQMVSRADGCDGVLAGGADGCNGVLASGADGCGVVTGGSDVCRVLAGSAHGRGSGLEGGDVARRLGMEGKGSVLAGGADSRREQPRHESGRENEREGEQIIFFYCLLTGATAAPLASTEKKAKS